MEENKKYCVWCGKENQLTDKVCVHCQKPLDPKENLFKDYLIEHTKDKFKSDVEDSIYEAIKNFLLSHLYGCVLVLSLIISFGMMMSGGQKVKMVSHRPEELVDVFKENEEADSNDLEIKAIAKRLNQYDNAIFHDVRIRMSDIPLTFESEYPKDLPRLEDIHASKELGYRGKSDMVYDREELVTYYKDFILGYKTTYDYDVSLNPESPESEIGKNLKKDGHMLAEVKMKETFLVTDDNGEFIDSVKDFMVVFVKKDNVWYVVEDYFLDGGQ